MEVQCTCKYCQLVHVHVRNESPISTAVPSTCIMELHVHLHIDEMKKISSTS